MTCEDRNFQKLITGIRNPSQFRTHVAAASISALSAASIVRYDASTAITRDPASAIQPV
jgi:hypothetical protein